ncbi:MAG TPA: transcription antitermination factor NusB [Pyrinomonadaceae bacterium]|nr:transcription antitermination factor NusB [Pyrinomonadaceae bacterium]
MSFDKSGKNSGSRRKARECALQMLFAADVVGPEAFTASQYWAELGFDELQKGAGTLALDIRDETEKLSGVHDSVRAWLKKADPSERSRKRSEWMRTFAASIQALRAAFATEVSDLVEDRIPSVQGTAVAAERAATEFDSLIAGLESKILSSTFKLPVEDRSNFAELRSQGHQSLKRLRNELIPEFSKLFGAVTAARPFAEKLVSGSLLNLSAIDERIRTRAEHWRIERMAIVDRNVLRLAVYEFLFEDTPHTVVINEALEIARRFSTFEATQFINGILDAIKLDLEKPADNDPAHIKEKSQSSST